MQLSFAVTAGVTLVIGWLIGTGDNTDGATVATWLIGISLFFGGFFATIDAVAGLWARRFQIDFLMIVAALGAVYIGHAIEGALLLVLFSLGHAAEHYALDRAQRSIESLATLRPTSALVADPDSGEVREVAVEALCIGDTVVVRPDSRIAADGVVIDGESNVDQSSVTGESMPVDKLPAAGFDPLVDDWQSLASEHKVFAGTINGGGAMRLRVTRVAEDMTLARVIRMVTEAKTHRSPTQRLTDSFERYFVPAVLTFVVLLLFTFVVFDEPFSASLYRAIGVLVAASPCALALATPSAVLSAVARGGRDGVLFKGGGPLEELGRVEVIGLDKTGTLTVGKPAVVEVIAGPGESADETLRIAAAVESHSDHPLAGAIIRAAQQAESSEISDADIENTVMSGRSATDIGLRTPIAVQIRRLTGRGMSATIGTEPVWVGNLRLFQWRTEPRSATAASSADLDSAVEPPQPPDWVVEADRELRHRGQTTMIVCRGEVFLGVIGLADTTRPAAAAMIGLLRKLGIKQVVMLSGDNQFAAEAIAREVGIDEIYGDLSPEDKLDIIERLAERSPVAMIGDGVNDAPALAAATVSIAMGAAGSDVALETADIALMADDLTKLPLAVALSRRASQVIRQNLWISLGMIAVLVPATLMGLQLAVAVVFHEGSTLLVVANALRLLAYRPTAE